MEFEEVVNKRRSIRNYKDKDVEDEKIEKLLDAAMRAPSANNRQPWHFVVIESEKTQDEIMDIHPYSSMLEEAPLAIAVCGNTEKSEHYWVQDCSAATQNLLLMAENLGLGAVWLGVYPRKNRHERIGELLELPKHIIPLSIVAVGYPAEESREVDRFDEDNVHRERWNG